MLASHSRSAAKSVRRAAAGFLFATLYLLVSAPAAYAGVPPHTTTPAESALEVFILAIMVAVGAVAFVRVRDSAREESARLAALYQRAAELGWEVRTLDAPELPRFPFFPFTEGNPADDPGPQYHHVVRGTHAGLGFCAFEYRWKVITPSSTGKGAPTKVDHSRWVALMLAPDPLPAFEVCPRLDDPRGPVFAPPGKDLGSSLPAILSGPKPPSAIELGPEFDREFWVSSAQPAALAALLTPEQGVRLAEHGKGVGYQSGGQYLLSGRHEPWDAVSLPQTVGVLAGVLAQFSAGDPLPTAAARQGGSSG